MEWIYFVLVGGITFFMGLIVGIIYADDGEYIDEDFED